jgi:hypothetical protein
VIFVDTSPWCLVETGGPQAGWGMASLGGEMPAQPTSVPHSTRPGHRGESGQDHQATALTKG